MEQLAGPVPPACYVVQATELLHTSAAHIALICSSLFGAGYLFGLALPLLYNIRKVSAETVSQHCWLQPDTRYDTLCLQFRGDKTGI